MKTASNDRWVAYLVAFTAAALVLLFGLQRFGIWQPSEIRVADMAREVMAGTPVALDRPPAQLRAVAMGFRLGNASEMWGRLPGAVLAFLAALSLVGAARAAGDRRLAVYAGIAYATLPLVFFNARTMHGGGVAQSAATLALAGLVMALWGRDNRARLAGVAIGGAGLALSVPAAGAFVGLVPVLGGVGLAAMLRGTREALRVRLFGAAAAVAGAVVAVLAVRASGFELEGYSHLLGASNRSPSPTQWQTFEGYFEHIAHATFPWTGLIPFGLVRLASPPSRVPDGAHDPGLDPEEASEVDPWRESGMRLAAFLTAGVALAVQTYHMQLFGMTPYIAVAPLALGAAVLLRDFEREQAPWRTVALSALLLTALMVRDYLQFPKSGYAALGLPDGGPAFPTGFATKLSEWTQLVQQARAAGGEMPPLPAEGYTLLGAALFALFGLLVFFQGAGEAQPVAWSAPRQWIRAVETDAQADCEAERAELGRPTGGSYLLAHLGLVLGAVAALCVVVGFIVPETVRTLTTPGRNALRAVAVAPILVVAGVYALLALWNAYAFLGRPGGRLHTVLGSRAAWVPLIATVTALVSAQGYLPALSEHMSPRGVWAVIRALRHGNEPIARFGGPGEDPATRYYTRATVETIPSESAAVAWLTRPDRSFLVVGSDVFPSLNSAYRAARQRNIPIADATNSNLFVAVSELEGRPSRNPLDAWVMSTRPRMRHPAREATRWEDTFEYIGYDLDSGGRPYVALGSSFKVTFNFHVLRDPGRHWQLFVHTDGPGPRINGDHEAVNGRYPTNFWRQGDFIRDQLTVNVPLTYRPGIYTVYMGFFDGGDRMRLEGGDHDRDNRVVVCRVNVR